MPLNLSISTSRVGSTTCRGELNRAIYIACCIAMLLPCLVCFHMIEVIVVCWRWMCTAIWGELWVSVLCGPAMFCCFLGYCIYTVFASPIPQVKLVGFSRPFKRKLRKYRTRQNREVVRAVILALLCGHRVTADFTVLPHQLQLVDRPYDKHTRDNYSQHSMSRSLTCLVILSIKVAGQPSIIVTRVLSEYPWEFQRITL